MLVSASFISLVAQVSLSLGGFTMIAIMEAFTRNYTSYGQVARVIVRMGCIQVKLENIVSHVILL